MLDCLPLPTARIASNLHLLEYSWCKHVFLDLDSVAITGMTSIHLSIRTSAPVTFITYLLFLQLKLGRVSIVEISQRDANSNFHIRTTSLSRLMAEMSTSAEESREQIEWIMVVSATSLCSLFQPFMSILVVDLARFRVREGFVCFCYFDELLFCGVVASTWS